MTRTSTRQLTTSNPALTKEIATGGHRWVWATQEMDGAVPKPTAFSTPAVQWMSSTDIPVHCFHDSTGRSVCCAALQGWGHHISHLLLPPFVLIAMSCPHAQLHTRPPKTCFPCSACSGTWKNPPALSSAHCGLSVGCRHSEAKPTCDTRISLKSCLERSSLLTSSITALTIKTSSIFKQ